MALRPLNSVGGFSVGEIPDTIIDGNGNITGYYATFEGNLLISNATAAWGVLTDNLYYSNGVPWDLQEAAGSNTQIQFNNNNDFGASANFTFDASTNLLTVIGNAQFNNANLGNLATANYVNIATALNIAGSGTANLGNLVNANYVNVSANLISGNVSVNNEISGNTANFSGNVILPNLTVNSTIIANVANFSGNVIAPNLTVNNEFSGNTANFTSNVTVNNFTTNNYFNGNIANFSGNVIVNNFTTNNVITANTANFSGNVVLPNLQVNLELKGNTANFSGNVVLPNLNVNLELQANTANFDGNVVMDNWLYVANTANVGNLRTDNLLYANGTPWDLQEAAGSNTQIQYNDGNNNFGASANFTFNDATNVLTVNGNANVTNTLLTPNVNSGSGNLTLTSNGFSTVYDNTGNVTFPANGTVTVGTLVGNVQANINITAPNTTLLFSDNGLVDGSNAFTFNKLSNSVVLTGNLQVQNANLGNLAYANYINVASNLVSNNVTVNLELSGNTANFSGNVIVPNLTVNSALAGNTANFSGNVIVPNLTVNLNVAGNTANFTGNISAANVAAGNLVTANFANIASNTITNNLTVNNEIGGNTANFSGNVILPNLTVNLELQANTANFDGAVVIDGNLNVANLNTYNIANGNSNIRIFQDANLEFSSAGSANVVTITGTELLASGNIRSTGGNIVANGNITANSFLVGANLAVTGEANVGSLLTSNISSNGNLTITAVGTDKNINLVPGGPNGVVDVSLARVIQVGDPTAPHDAATKEYVDNIAQGLSVHTAVRVTSATNLNATYTPGGTTQTTTTISGGKTITFSANHGLSIGDEIYWTSSFNGIIANDSYFVYSTPALNQITVKAGFYGAEVTTLTNGTGLSQPSRANSGVGATLTNAGANAAIQIDGVSLASTNRVLVQGQTNAFENGVYTVTTVGSGAAQWVLTRASDADTYDPKSTTGLAYGDYFFVQEGLSYAGSSYVLTTPVGEIIFGVTNIGFTQFSAAGSYSAGSGINITGTTISANVDNDTTAISAGNIVVKAGANLTTPNIGDASFSSLSWNNLSNGNVTANNLSISNIANITLDLTVGGNIQANGTISSNANVSGLNLTTSGNVHATGVVVAANVTANSTVFASNANVTGTTITNVLTVNTAFSGNTANFSGNLLVNNLTVNLELAGNTANFVGNVVANNFSTSGSGGNITGANVVIANTFQGNLVATYANVTGNVTGGNLVTAGVANVAQLNVTANVTSDLLPNANLTHDLGNATLRWENVYAGNLDASGNINSTGNLSANNFTANIFIANTAIEIGPTTIFAGNVTTTSITANQTISSVPVSGVTGVEWLVKGYDSSGAKYSMAMITAVTDGANADFSTFGTVNLGASTGTLVVNIVGSNIALQVTPSSSNSTVWVTQYRTL